MANQWYVQHGGKQVGPLTSANLKKLAADGKITPATTVRLGIEGNWVPASRVQGLFGGSAATNASPAAMPPKAAAKTTPKAIQPAAPAPLADFDELDALIAPPIEPPPAPPRANPLGTPVTPLPPRGRLPKAVPAEAPSITSRIIGGVAIILGTVALATCWLPVMGGLVGWTGIVAGGLGLVAGGAGLALAATHKGSGLMLNVSGASSAAVGLILSIVLGVAFGMFSGKPTPPPMVANVIPSAKPAPIEVPEPEPEPEIKWFDASEPIQQENIKAQIMSVGIEQVALESSDLSTLRKQKPQPMLKIKVAVQNTTPDKIVQFTGWIGGGDAISQGVGKLLEGSEVGKAVQAATPTARLVDNIGNAYPQAATVSVFGAQLPTGQDNSLRPDQTRQAEMIFPPPLPTIEFLRLELAPSAYAGSEPLRWQIPKDMVKGLAKATATDGKESSDSGKNQTPEGKPRSEGSESFTADTIEQHLKAMGFSVPSTGSKISFAGGGGTVSSGLIPRPIGEPKKRAADSGPILQYAYECENAANGAKITAKVEDGRFLFFADDSPPSTKAMQDLLRRLDPATAEKFAEPVKEPQKPGSQAGVIRHKNVDVRTTKKGILLTSRESPAVFGSEAPDYGLEASSPRAE